MFLPFMCRLRFLEIVIYLTSATFYDFEILSFLMGSLSISLTSPTSLEHLVFNISFYWHNGSKSRYHSDHTTFYEHLRDADVWSHLDSIANHPTGSQLQRVDINIGYAFDYSGYLQEPEEDEVMEAVLDGLPLLRAKGILFVKAFVSG